MILWGLLARVVVVGVVVSDEDAVCAARVCVLAPVGELGLQET